MGIFIFVKAQETFIPMTFWQLLLIMPLLNKYGKSDIKKSAKEDEKILSFDSAICRRFISS